MAAKGEDTLTQIQKYKAMLSSKRNKGDEKAVKKPKKKRLRKGNVATGLETVLTVPGLAATNDEETSSKSRAESSKEESVDSIKLEANSVVSQESKQSLELPNTNDGEQVEPKPTITSSSDQESTKSKESELVEDTSPKEEQEKKEKSKGLSLRRKRKKSKKKGKETEDNEENLEEKFPCKESAAELGKDSVAPLSQEAKQDEILCDEVSAGQKLEANEESGDDNKPKDGTEGKEKISRAQKFKRWASFTKQKKANDSLVTENDQFELETSKSTISSIKEPESLDNGTSERDSIDERLPAEKVEDSENNPAKRETVNDQEDLECSPLPEKQRRRSVSLDETTDKENAITSPDNDQRTRSASFGKGNIISSLTVSLRREKTRKKSQEKKLSVGQDNELTSSQNQDETTKLDTQNNEEVNEVENEQASEQKAKDSIVEDRETGDENKELQNAESPVNDEQPKKKKKSFLRKLSSKNLKANKKDDNGTEETKKPEVSYPLLLKYQILTESDVLNNSQATEVSPEKSNKRKKSGLNLKLPKALKRVKSTDYEATGGEEAEKELEKDEKFLQNNSESQEQDQESAENDEVAGSNEVDKPQDCKEGENADDVEVETEQDGGPRKEDENVKATNDMLTPIAEKTKTVKEDEKVIDEIKEEEKYCKTHSTDESSVPGENNEMVEEKNSELTTSEKEEDQLEKRKQNIGHDITKKDEKREINIESKDKSESQDIANSPCKIEEETVQESKQPESEPKKPEDDANQPEEMSTLTEGELKKLEEGSQPVEDITKASGDEPNELGEKSEAEDMITRSEHEVEQPGETPALPTSKGEPKESNDTCLQREQSSEASSELKSANELLDSVDGAVMPAEGTSNFHGDEVERSIEVSVKTKALIDSYILIDHSLQLSQEFLNRVESMDMNYSNRRKSRCSIM